MLCSENCIKKINKWQEKFSNSSFSKVGLLQALDVLQSKSDEDLQLITGFDRDKFSKVFGDPHSRKYNNLCKSLKDCGSYLTFRWHYKVDVTKLVDANFCKKDKLCSACAIRRAFKQQEKFLKAVQEYPELLKKNWYYIVIPVKHNKKESIETVNNRLMKFRKSVTKSLRNKKAGKSAGFWGQFDGGMGATEVTRTHNGWNVHLNLLVCSDYDISLRQVKTYDKKGNLKTNYINDELMAHLERVAGSYVHNISKVDMKSTESIKSNLVEIMKYSLKFSSLNLSDLIHVYLYFYRKPLFFTYGNLRGLKLDDVQLEGVDVIDDEFIELIYMRTYGFLYERHFPV